jgi:hypothetical protein
MGPGPLFPARGRLRRDDDQKNAGSGLRRVTGGVKPRTRESSDRVGTALAGADADRLVDRRDEDLAVADPAGMGRVLDRLHRALNQPILHHHLDLHLRQEVDHVFGPAIQLGMAFLATETLGLGDGDTLDADFVKSLMIASIFFIDVSALSALALSSALGKA